MNQKVLVAYATKYGATEEIAERIGLALGNAGVAAEVLAVDKVKDVTAYAAVVLGSAVYIGGWRKEAAKFLQENEESLTTRPVWLFSSGPTGEGDPVEQMDGWTVPNKLKPVADRIRPREIVVFHGDVNVEKLNFMDRFMIKNVKAPTGDFRDWAAIDAWAEEIAASLVAQH